MVSRLNPPGLLVPFVPRKPAQTTPKPPTPSLVRISEPRPTTRISGGSSGSRRAPDVIAPKPASKPQIEQGFKPGMARVANVLNPFSNTPIRFTNPFTGQTYMDMDVGAGVRSVVRVSQAALAIPLATQAVGLWAPGAVGIKAATAGKAALGTSRFLVPTAAAGAGLLAGGLLFGNNGARNAPQSLNQTPQQDTRAEQTTNPSIFNTDNSNNWQSAAYSIYDSPGASIYGNQDQGRPISQNTTPFQALTPSQDVSGNQAQKAATGTPWLLIAAAAGAAYLLTR